MHTRHVWSVVNIATVYHIWKQRNNALDNQVSLTATEVFRFIDRDIKTIITARRMRKHLSPLISLWLC
ncbi:unnamed protein product [Brassica rapa]|uniref:Uncharacterized protein n=1 Tax=Brassica campestris TaxID=3711 RepID=A0A3P6A774_BRACM|nr:unnamed protein product [Brassica rapa]VDC80078.1 unnamed protein product [Brassica rapa]